MMGKSVRAIIVTISQTTEAPTGKRAGAVDGPITGRKTTNGSREEEEGMTTPENLIKNFIKSPKSALTL